MSRYVEHESPTDNLVVSNPEGGSSQEIERAKQCVHIEMEKNGYVLSSKKIKNLPKHIKKIQRRYISQMCPTLFEDLGPRNGASDIVDCETYTHSQVGLFPDSTFYEDRTEIELRETCYVLYDIDGHVHLYIDHTHCFFPTKQTFKNGKEIDLYEFMNELFSKSAVGTYEEYVGFLHRFEFVAKRRNEKCDQAHFLENRQMYQELRKKNPMHCYAAGVAITTEDGLEQFQSSMQRMNHEKERVTFSNNQFFRQLITKRQILQTAEYDVLPGSMELSDVQFVVAQMLIGSLYGLHVVPSGFMEVVRTFNFTFDEISAYIKKICLRYAADKLRDRRRVTFVESDLSTSDGLSFQGFVLFWRKFGFVTAQDAVLFARLAFSLPIEKADFFLQLSLFEENISWEGDAEECTANTHACDWAHIEDFQKAMKKWGMFHHLTDNPESLYGTRMRDSRQSRGLISIASIPKPLSLPLEMRTTYGKHAFDGFFLEWLAGFSSAISLQYTSAEKLAEVLVDFEQFVLSDFCMSQLSEADYALLLHVQQICMGFLKSLKPNDVCGGVEKLNIFRQSVFKEYSPQDRRIRSIAKTLLFAIMAQRMGGAVARLGHAQHDVQIDESIHMSADAVPFHLAVENARVVLDVREKICRILSDCLGRDKMRSYPEHYGCRIRNARKNQKPPECEVYRYQPRGFVKWICSDGSQKWIKEFYDDKYCDESTGLSQKLKSYEEEKILGEMFFAYLQNSLQQLLAELDAAFGYQEVLGVLKRLYGVAYLAYELFYLTEGNSSCGAGGPFESVITLHENVQSAINHLQTMYATAPGEISIPEHGTVFFFGPNGNGKTTMMRGIAYAAMCMHQGIPTTGNVQLPGELRLYSPIGAERQRAGESMFSPLVRELKVLLEDDADQHEPTLRVFDEVGRTTGDRYGMMFLMMATILSHLDRRSFLGVATHFHELKMYLPLFSSLGIQTTPLFVKDRRVAKLSDEQQTTSDAFEVLRQLAPGPWLQYWPNQEGIQENELLATGSTSLETIRGQNIDDLFGLGKEDRLETLHHLFPDWDENVCLEFLYTFSNPEKGECIQRFLVLVHDKMLQNAEDFQIFSDFFNLVLEISKMRGDFYERADGLFSIVKKRQSDCPRDQVGQWFLTESNRMRPYVLRVAKMLLDAVWNTIPGSTLLSERLVSLCESLLDGLKTNIYGDFSVDGISRAMMIIQYTQLMFAQDSGYSKGDFSDESVFSAEKVWNPSIGRYASQVCNDVKIDFTGNNKGHLLIGENYSGKTTYERAVQYLAWMTLCTGFGPGKNIVIPKKMMIVSKTQPANDTAISSSMQEEVLKRVRPILQAVALLPDRYILAAIDEPGAPTSPEDASRLIQMFLQFSQSVGNFYLMLTTHAQRTLNDLEERQLPVDISGFQLLSETPYKRIPGGVFDSNALQVAQKLGLHPSLVQVGEYILKYMDAVHDGKDTQEFVEEIVSMIRTLVQNAREIYQREEAERIARRNKTVLGAPVVVYSR